MALGNVWIMGKSNRHIHSIAIAGEWGGSTYFSALNVCHGLDLTWCGRLLGGLPRMYGSRIGVDSCDCVSSTMDSFSSSPWNGVSLARVPSSVDVFFRPCTSPPSSVALFRPSDRVSWTVSSRFVRHGLVRIHPSSTKWVDFVPSIQDLPTRPTQNGGWRNRWGRRVLIGRNPWAGFPRGGHLCKPCPPTRIGPKDDSNDFSNWDRP